MAFPRKKAPGIFTPPNPMAGTAPGPAPAAAPVDDDMGDPTDQDPPPQTTGPAGFAGQDLSGPGGGAGIRALTPGVPVGGTAPKAKGFMQFLKPATTKTPQAQSPAAIAIVKPAFPKKGKKSKLAMIKS